MFRLTEEEIVAEASKDKEYCQLSVDVGMWAAREQIKRVGEWGEGGCEGHEEVGMHEGYARRKDCWGCWQALKKEVGL